MLAAAAEPTTQFTRRDAGRLIAASAVLVAGDVGHPGHRLPARAAAARGRQAGARARPGATRPPSTRATSSRSSSATPPAPRSSPSTTSRPRAPPRSPRSSCGRSTARSRRSTPRSPTGSRPRTARPSSSTSLPGSDRRAGPRSRASTRRAGPRVRTEAARVLETRRAGRAARQPGRLDQRLVAGRMAGDLNADERALAAALIAPLSPPTRRSPRTSRTRRSARAAEDVKPVIKSWERGETIVRVGDRVDDVAFEAIDYFGLNQGGLDVARLVGFVVLSCLVIGLLLDWTWRFRREFWHRNNVLLLLSLLLLFAVFALKLTAGRPWLPVRAAARRGRDAGHGPARRGRGDDHDRADRGARGGRQRHRRSSSAAYVLFGGIAGIVTVRRGDRLAVFVQAGIAVFVVNALVVHDVRAAGRPGHPRRRSSCGAPRPSSAGGAAVATVGSFAVHRVGVRDPHGVPAARAREPVAAAAAAPARRDARARTTTR